jgi:hypothetical protein
MLQVTIFYALVRERAQQKAAGGAGTQNLGYLSGTVVTATTQGHASVMYVWFHL